MTTLSTSGTPTRHAPLPVLRAAVFALVGTVLGVSAHHVVTEAPMPWRHSAAAASVLFAVGLVGTRRRRSLAAVVAACGAAQLALHLWLATTHAHGSAPADTAEAMPAHVHAMDTRPAWHGRLHDSLTMTAVHVAAAVLVAVLLHRADTVCWSLARGLTTAVDAVRARIATAWALLARRAAPAEPELPALVRARLDRPPFKEAVLTDVVVRRGPPRARFSHAI